MYLSQLMLNPRSFAARRDLASAYELHASLCRAFAAPDQVVPKFLWRLESPQKYVLPTVLVQSADLPDWEVFAADKFRDYFIELPEVKLIPLEHLQLGQVLRFRLKANPTVTKRDSDNPEKRKRHGLKGIEEQLEWLSRQGQRGGFTVRGAMVAQSERAQMVKHKGGNPITVQSVLYEGHLKVADLELFKGALASGLGHAKALGFGLLSVARGA